MATRVAVSAFTRIVAGVWSGWPPSPGTQLLGCKHDGHKILCGFGPNACIVLQVWRDTDCLLELKSPPIRLVQGGGVWLKLQCDESSEFQVFINDIAVLRQNHLEVIDLALPPVKAGTYAWHAPEASTVCRHWVRRRSKIYANQTSVSMKDERERLRRSHQALQDGLKSVAEGHVHHLDSIRAQVRQLVVNLGDSYVPALLRVAGRLELPLPVYADPREKKLLSDLIGPIPGMTDTTQRVPTAMRRFGTGQQVTDFEEVLQRTFYCKRQPDGTSKKLGLAQVLAQAANQLGGAHLAPELSESMEDMMGVHLMDLPQADSVVVQTAKCAHALLGALLDGSLNALQG